MAQQKDRGADFIKVYSLLPRDAYFAIADEARKRGIAFVGHVPISVTVAETSDAGQKSIEHLTGVALGCSSQEEALFAEVQGATAPAAIGRVTTRAFETYDEAKAQALFARFVRNGTWQCPTLTVLRSISRLDDPQLANDTRLKYMSKGLRSSWDPKNDFRFKAITGEGLGCPAKGIPGVDEARGPHVSRWREHPRRHRCVQSIQLTPAPTRRARYSNLTALCPISEWRNSSAIQKMTCLN